LPILIILLLSGLGQACVYLERRQLVSGGPGHLQRGDRVGHDGRCARARADRSREVLRLPTQRLPEHLVRIGGTQERAGDRPAGTEDLDPAYVAGRVPATEAHHRDGAAVELGD
jgi:hypothetical protein